MNRLNAAVPKLLAVCAAALLMPTSFAGATDATYGSSNTLIEPGVDLGEYVESGRAPPLALDAQGSAWIVITKGRANPALQRIDTSGRLANLLPLPTLPLPASVSLRSTGGGDMVLCARTRDSFDLQVLRIKVDADSVASVRWQTAARVPGPTTVGNIISGVQSPVTVYSVGCRTADDGSVLMHYQKTGGLNNTLVLHRFLADGTPDASFGTEGMMQSTGTFPLGQTIQFGAISIVWVSADSTINVVSEGGLLRETVGSPVLHPVSLTRIIPPTSATGAWQFTQSDLSFTVGSFDMLPTASFADGDDLVFVGQSFASTAKARGYVRRVNTKTRLPVFTVDELALPSFGPAQTSYRVVLVNGTYLVMGGSGEDASVGMPQSTARNTTWIKRLSTGSTMQSVAGGLAIDTINGGMGITPLPAGGFLLTSAALARKDGSPAVPGILRFAPDYLLPRTVEFRDSQRDTYFFTANTDEIEQVWAWIRSGVLPWQAPHEFGGAQSFKTWPPDAPVGDTLRMCRFFIPSLGTHFYSARPDECAKYSQAPFAGTFVAEDPQFRVFPTVADPGVCSDDKATITRLFRPAPRAPNHRWVAGRDAVRALQAQGWLNDGLVFCEAR